MTRATATLAANPLRRVVEGVGRILSPGVARVPTSTAPRQPAPPPDPGDHTRELLVPGDGDRSARRARRRARAYLEHRRAKLAEDLAGRDAG